MKLLFFNIQNELIMRPRIRNGFGIITFTELKKFLIKNNCFGLTVRKVSPTILEYKYLMMFRSHTGYPIEMKITVSRISKRVIGLSIGGREYDNIDSFMKHVRIK